MKLARWPPLHPNHGVSVRFGDDFKDSHIVWDVASVDAIEQHREPFLPRQSPHSNPIHDGEAVALDKLDLQLSHLLCALYTICDETEEGRRPVV